MAFTVSPWVAYVVAWAGTVAGVYFLFEKGEDVLTKEAKAEVRNWIRTFYLIRSPTNWSSAFLLMFDGLFGKRMFSIRRIVSSCLASLLYVLILTILWIGIRPDEALEFFNEDTLSSQLLFIFIMTMILNLIPDCVSLAETRAVLEFLSKSCNYKYTVVVLIIDIILTTIIFLTGYILLLSYLFVILILGWGTGLSDLLDIQFTDLLYSLRNWISLSDSPPIGIFFYSTFFTSIWIYLYILSAFISHLVTKMISKVRLTMGLLDIDDKPIRSLGYVSIVMITFIFVAIPIVKGVMSYM